MMIERIKMHNFGPFYQDHEIIFANNGSGVHLIRGDNGQGKTSIQRAILWCLYGKVVDRKGQEIRPTSLINRAAQKEDIYQFAVIINFNHEENEWTISRKMEAKTNSDKKYIEGMQINVIKDGIPLPNPQQEIERILPFDVNRFFFFDGEMLLDQDSHAMTILRESIEHVLGIPYLKTARDDLYEVQRRMEREISKHIRKLGGKAFEEIVDDFQSINEEIDDRKNEIKKIQHQIAILETEISDQKRRLADIQSVQKLARQRIETERGIETLEAKRDALMADIRKNASQMYKTILANTSESIIAHLQEKHDAVMAKYNEKQRLIGRADDIERAITAQKCKFCGTVLNELALQGLKSELKDLRIQIKNLTEVPEPNLEYENHLNRLKLLKDSIIDRSVFKNIETKIFEIDHKLGSENSKLVGLKEKLKGVDEEEPRELEIDIERRTNEKGRLEGRKSSEEKRLLENLDAKANLEQKMASIDQEELKVLKKRIQAVKAIAEVIDAAVCAYRDERRSDVEKKASDIFREIRTKESFSRLEINEQFGLNIITDDGTVLNRAEWRSSGEEQIVALALIGALNRCAQVRAPVFMDTPFGRLDTKHGKKVLTFLPKFSDEVVLLVTDREFRKGDENYLEGKIMSDHTVLHKGEKQGSIIVKTMGAG